ncbi:MAG TPA: YcxB family protein [Flavisolibacter sp.]|nr:YcxB family protein [Flavisolibacter sp.]
MTVHFTYDKKQVIQALRYHFISKREIRLMIILVNVFAIASAALFYFKVILPFAFLISSFLWIVLMLTFWFILPMTVYRKAATFKDHFTMNFEDDGFSLGNERGSRSWEWRSLSTYIETPHFFHLYFDATSFFLVPKIAFSDDQRHEMRDLLKAKVKK